eukprot:GHVT01040595.1.p1 GENE.GHVT01040595.1~~GHVT01040595.1.p1  ORF type:complete len:181 (-),score=11.12 GHVT01040595.1:855-1397(-)
MTCSLFELFADKAYTPTWVNLNLTQLDHVETVIPLYFKNESLQRAEDAYDAIRAAFDYRSNLSVGCLLLLSQDGDYAGKNGGNDMLYANFGDGLKGFPPNAFTTPTVVVPPRHELGFLQLLSPENLSEEYPKFPLYAYKHTIKPKTETDLWKRLPAYGTQITENLNSQLRETLSNVAIKK